MESERRGAVEELSCEVGLFIINAATGVLVRGFGNYRYLQQLCFVRSFAPQRTTIVASQLFGVNIIILFAGAPFCSRYSSNILSRYIRSVSWVVPA